MCYWLDPVLYNSERNPACNLEIASPITPWTVLKPVSPINNYIDFI